MSNCNHDCGSCDKSCGEREEDFRARPHELSFVKKVIGVVSGKGGVGKSLVTCLLADKFNKRGYSSAVLDADITGPSVPKAFGITEKASGGADFILPVKSSGGVRIMSLNLLTENETDPVVWRGPVIAGTVKQFWTDVAWGDVDYMFVDMPPGTGDVPLTVFQSFPVDGIIIVTSPQGLVSMIVEKAVNMARMMNIPIIGVVENYSYFVCPDCGKKAEIFGKSHIEEIASRFSIPVLARFPMDPELASLMDEGKIENNNAKYADDVVSAIEKFAPIQK